MFRYYLMLGLLACSSMLGACQSVQDQCARASNPAECVKVAAAGGDVNDYLLYGMAGYMLSSALNGGQRQTVIVQDPHYRGYRRPIASYAASRDYVRQRTVTTTTRRSPFGQSTSTTTVSRSTYRPSSYRSSSSSFRSSRR
ncbi:MAG: DUF1190 domain-containing protein [Sphingobium sp.]|uniref:DUF1190 domain-containing protein n=1 Tax=Sphingobium sp. TaxID=1912891 RepID=UPI0029AF3424|nr:DUF1190 domain-containing protein [Sphingobium sp.]MDX3908889.1 DUF1190 domain-containing protein [Sphingobium sp.]